ncbi:hypothetical protein ACFL9S_06660 [Erwinia sp. AnSW2-5]|uniref:hypothetical protein n=1 Tax=Erwinia sp. AnSW2-5 TaxID=3367692 RepID=UPI00385DB6B2
MPLNMPLFITLLIALLTPGATAIAASDNGACQQNCYVQNSRCDRDKNSDCSGALQRCVQACPR